MGLTGDEVYELYRLLAIAKYEDRYVIPKAHAEAGRELEELGCSLDYEGGPGRFSASGPFGEASGRPMPVAVENFHALKARQTRRGLRADRGRRGPGQPAQLGRRGPAGHARHPARRQRTRCSHDRR